MKSTASSAGTSMPSERQRAFERMRQVLSVSPLSQSSRAFRFRAWYVPSTCCVSQIKSVGCWSSGSRSVAVSIISSQYLTIAFDSEILFVNAMTRFKGLTGSLLFSFDSGFWSARQQPTIFVASLMLISLSPRSAAFTSRSDTASTTTL